MNPIAFKIFNFPILWYGILIGSGMLLGILISKITCKYRNVNYDALLNTVLISLPIGIIGARIYYVAFNFDYYRLNPQSILNIREGGLAIHGGIIFGVTAAFIYTRINKLNFLDLVDTAAPSIIIAQAIGRWGNFMNSEAHGREVSLAFIEKFPSFIQKGMNIDGIYYHPTFLYESLWNLIVFVVLILILKKVKEKGIVFMTYIGLYSLGRFFVEGLRTDSLMIGSFRIAQLVSLSGVIIWIVYLIFLIYKKKGD